MFPLICLLDYLLINVAPYFLFLWTLLHQFIQQIGALLRTRCSTSRDFHLCRPQPIVHDCPSSLLSCKNTKDRPGEGVAEERLSFPLSAASPLTSHRGKEINTRGEITKLQWLLMTDLVWVRIATLSSCRDKIRLGLIRQGKEKWQPLGALCLSAFVCMHEHRCVFCMCGEICIYIHTLCTIRRELRFRGHNFL